MDRLLKANLRFYSTEQIDSYSDGDDCAIRELRCNH